MKVELIRIGNSRGIRIPKRLIKQCGFGDTVELRLEQDRLVITAERQPRQAWARAFESAKTEHDDFCSIPFHRMNSIVGNGSGKAHPPQ